jgi:hypothetical protein
MISFADVRVKEGLTDSYCLIFFSSLSLIPFPACAGLPFAWQK